MPTTQTHWPLQGAKDQFSQLVKAAALAPQTVTVHGKPAAIVLSPQAYAKLKRAPRGKLSDELLRPGLIEDGEDLFARDDDRDLDRAVEL